MIASRTDTCGTNTPLLFDLSGNDMHYPPAGFNLNLPPVPLAAGVNDFCTTIAGSAGRFVSDVRHT